MSQQGIAENLQYFFLQEKPQLMESSYLVTKMTQLEINLGKRFYFFYTIYKYYVKKLYWINHNILHTWYNYLMFRETTNTIYWHLTEDITPKKIKELFPPDISRTGSLAIETRENHFQRYLIEIDVRQLP